LGDAPLVIGQSFYDSNSLIRITVLGKGNTTPESLDVSVEFNQTSNPTPTPTPTCTYSITPASQGFGSVGGTGSVSITALSGCSWTAGSSQSFVNITSGSIGNGNGTVNYSVAANASSGARSATISIAGQVFTIQQAGATTSSYTLIVSPSIVAPGGQLTVSWTAPSGSSTVDWIGLYKVGASNFEYLGYIFTNGATSGSFTTALTQPGQYEFRYLLDNGYTSVATSNTVTVQSTPTSTPTATPTTTPTVNPTPTPPPNPTPPPTATNRLLAIDSGRTTVGVVDGWQQDGSSQGGGTYATTATQNLSGVVDPAPQDIYKTVRYGMGSYYIGGFTPGATYRIRLHFSEIYFSSAGQRIFDVSINGVLVADDLDIYAAAGGANKAYIVSQTATANSSGDIIVGFVALKDSAKISGVEIEALE
jgi:hypothetical protein